VFYVVAKIHSWHRKTSWYTQTKDGVKICIIVKTAAGDGDFEEKIKVLKYLACQRAEFDKIKLDYGKDYTKKGHKIVPITNLAN
jgi:hypothetical protein